MEANGEDYKKEYDYYKCSAGLRTKAAFLVIKDHVNHTAALFESAKSEFMRDIEDLPDYTKLQLLMALNQLIENIETNPEAISEFTKSCHTALKGEHSCIMKTVLKVAMTAVAAVYAAMCGFVLITGFTASAAAIAFNGSLALAGGGWAAYRLFKPSAGCSRYACC